MLVRAHGGRIQEQGAGVGEGFGLQILPESLPDPARFPAPEAHVNGMPVTELGRQIPPRTAGALQMEDRFEELSVGHCAGRPSLRMLGRSHGRFELLPDGIGDDFTHGMLQHPKLQSRTRIIVPFIIREHCLERVVNFCPWKKLYFLRTKVQQAWDGKESKWQTAQLSDGCER